MGVRDYSTTAASNTALASLYVGPDMARADVDNALRHLMADAKSYIEADAVNVLNYIPTAQHAGILAGTDTNDHTAYFQAAAVAANQGVAAGTGKGGKVRVPAGTYKVSEVGCRDTWFIGDGHHNTIIKAVAGGTAADFMFDATLDRDGSTVNTVGNGGVRNLKIDATGSTRSGVRTYGGGQSMDNVWVYAAQVGFAIGLPIWSTFTGLRAENCLVKGFYTYSGAGDTATMATFNSCLATGCYRGWHITQLMYSTWNACCGEISTEINWYVEGNANGVSACYSLVFNAPATEGSGTPFYFKKVRDLVVVAPRVVNADGSTHLLYMDDAQGKIVSFSTPGAVPGGKSHLDITNSAADGLIMLDNCASVSFSDYATMRRTVTINGSDPAVGTLTTSAKRLELDTATNTERTYSQIADIDGYKGEVHYAGDGTRLAALRRIGGVILSSNGAMGGGGATFQPGDLHLYLDNANKLMLEGKRPDGTRILAEVTLASVTNPA